MSIATTKPVVLTLALLLGACAEEGNSDFRGAANAGYDGDGDLTIYMGATAAEVGCDIWDLVGSTVSGGTASGTPGVAIISAVEVSSSPTGWGVADANGNVTCTYEYDGDLKLRDASDGTILMTSNEAFLMNGDYNPNSGVNWQVADYTFRDEHIREPGWWGEKILTGTVHIAWMQQWRKLLIGAAIEGYCGAPGIVDAPPEPDHDEP